MRRASWVEQAEINRPADAHEEDRREDRGDGPHLVLDGVELIGAGENDPRGESADDQGRAGQRRQARTSPSANAMANTGST